jgi:two-component system, LuxR family, response regulator FixJ
VAASAIKSDADCGAEKVLDIRKGRTAMHEFAAQDEHRTVFVVDPDPATGVLIRDLLDGSNLQCEIFAGCRDFLGAFDPLRAGCLVAEIRIADMSGLQLQRRLASGGVVMPLLFVTAETNVAMVVELMRGGAVHVLEKPVRPVDLFTAIQEALTLNQDRRYAQHCRDQITELVARLSRKEREVLDSIARGKSAKGMAANLDLSARAVEQRRHSLMVKLHLDSPIELMRFAVLAQRTVEPAVRWNPFAGPVTRCRSSKLVRPQRETS